MNSRCRQCYATHGSPLSLEVVPAVLNCHMSADSSQDKVSVPANNEGKEALPCDTVTSDAALVPNPGPAAGVRLQDNDVETVTTANTSPIDCVTVTAKHASYLDAATAGATTVAVVVPGRSGRDEVLSKQRWKNDGEKAHDYLNGLKDLLKMTATKPTLPDATKRRQVRIDFLQKALDELHRAKTEDRNSRKRSRSLSQGKGVVKPIHELTQSTSGSSNRVQSGGKTTDKPNLGVSIHKVGQKASTVEGAAQPTTWQSSPNPVSQATAQETQAVLSQVATLQAEFDKLTGEFDMKKKRIVDAKISSPHRLGVTANNTGSKEDVVTPSILEGTELYAGSNSPRLQPPEATTVIIDSQDEDQVFRVPTTGAAKR